MIFPTDEILSKYGIDKALCPWYSLVGFDCFRSFISFSIGNSVTENHKLVFGKLFYFGTQLKFIKYSDSNPSQIVLDINGEQIQNAQQDILPKTLYDIFSKSALQSIDYWPEKITKKDNGEYIYFFCCTEENVQYYFIQFLSFCGICNLPTIVVGQTGCYICKLTDLGKEICEIYLKNKGIPPTPLTTGQDTNYNQLSSLIKEGKGKVVVNLVYAAPGSNSTIQIIGGDATNTNMAQGNENEQNND